mgnify:CR=1 FL=1
MTKKFKMTAKRGEFYKYYLDVINTTFPKQLTEREKLVVSEYINQGITNHMTSRENKYTVAKALGISDNLISVTLSSIKKKGVVAKEINGVVLSSSVYRDVGNKSILSESKVNVVFEFDVV